MQNKNIINIIVSRKTSNSEERFPFESHNEQHRTTRIQRLPATLTVPSVHLVGGLLTLCFRDIVETFRFRLLVKIYNGLSINTLISSSIIINITQVLFSSSFGL